MESTNGAGDYGKEIDILFEYLPDLLQMPKLEPELMKAKIPDQGLHLDDQVIRQMSDLVTPTLGVMDARVNKSHSPLLVLHPGEEIDLVEKELFHHLADLVQMPQLEPELMQAKIPQGLYSEDQIRQVSDLVTPTLGVMEANESHYPLRVLHPIEGRAISEIMIDCNDSSEQDVAGEAYTTLGVYPQLSRADSVDNPPLELAPSSEYHGVYQHSISKLYEAQISTNHRIRKQGAYELELEAAQVHDLAALMLGYDRLKKNYKFNFPTDNYTEQLEKFKYNFDDSLWYSKRPRTKGGSIKYIGIQKLRNRKWAARLSYTINSDTLEGSKSRKTLHLGVFEDQVQAARAYDMAVVHYKKDICAVKNFPPSSYHCNEDYVLTCIGDVETQK